MGLVVEVRDLVKAYGPTLAVNGVSLEIQEGEIFALLGPNGAGKSTTIEILEGHRDRQSGSVSVLGHDPQKSGREFRDRIGIVLQTSGVEAELTVREVLTIYRSSYRKPLPIDEVLDLIGLADSADKRVKTLSGGQQRRIDFGLGLIGDPDLIFLDEPTTGFDPSARRRAWEVINGLRSLGKTVLLTTHYLEEAEFLADRVAVIVEGKIVVEGTPESLTARAGETVIRFRLPAGTTAAELPVTIAATSQAGVLELSTSTPTADLASLTGWATAQGFELDGITVTRPTLEDVYLDLAAPAGETGD